MIGEHPDFDPSGINLCNFDANGNFVNLPEIEEHESKLEMSYYTSSYPVDYRDCYK
jgi:hypothetical protein